MPRPKKNRTQHCEDLSTLSETDTFVAMAQMVDPVQGDIPVAYDVWIDYDAAGLDPDEFSLCIRHDGVPDLQEGTYIVQLTTLEYIGQQVFASGAQANNASTACSARSERSTEGIRPRPPQPAAVADVFP